MDDLKDFDDETQARLVKRLKFFDGILSGTINAPPAMTIGMPSKPRSAPRQELKDNKDNKQAEEEQKSNNDSNDSSHRMLSILDKMGLANMMFDKNPSTSKPPSMYNTSKLSNNNQIPTVINKKSINSKKKYHLRNCDIIELNEKGYLLIDDFISKTNVFNKFNISNSNDFITQIQNEINEMKKNGKLKHAGMRKSKPQQIEKNMNETIEMKTQNEQSNELLVSNCGITGVNGKYHLSCKDEKNEGAVYINESSHVLVRVGKNSDIFGVFDMCLNDKCLNTTNDKQQTWILGKIDKKSRFDINKDGDKLFDKKYFSDNTIVLYITGDKIFASGQTRNDDSINSNKKNKVNWICIGGVNPAPVVNVSVDIGNSGSNGKNSWQCDTIRSDLHCWLHAGDKSIGKYLKSIIIEMDRIRVQLNDYCNFESNDTQCQVTLYPGNGTLYKTHIDEPVSDSNDNDNNNRKKKRRRLTCLLYLNDNSLDIENKGGCLRMHLGNDKHFDVKPFGGTLVLFNSQWLPHQVLPTYFNRYAITLWFY